MELYYLNRRKMELYYHKHCRGGGCFVRRNSKRKVQGLFRKFTHPKFPTTRCWGVFNVLGSIFSLEKEQGGLRERIELNECMWRMNHSLEPKGGFIWVTIDRRSTSGDIGTVFRSSSSTFLAHCE